jgi:uncharacterized DUF497 family protein
VNTERPSIFGEWHTEYPESLLYFDTGFPYIARMENRFDPAKDAANQQKHKLSLAFGDSIFGDDNHLILPTIRIEDGEARFKVLGLVDGKLFTGVFVWRDELPRFISVRRSNKGEERAYHSAC